MNNSPLSSRLANFLSSAFLALALLVAVGFAVHSMGLNEAKAKADAQVQTDERCGNTVFSPPIPCTRADIDCLCPIIVNPDDGPFEESDS